MGKDHITCCNDLTRNQPGLDSPWENWVSATKTRNFCNGETLLDWLSAFGKEAGFKRDTEYPGYDPRCDFLQFIFEKGRQFEEVVVSYLAERYDTFRVASHFSQIRSLEAATATWEQMLAGRQIIFQGVLWNPTTRTYGAPDLLVRSDVLARMFPSILGVHDASVPAADIPNSDWHYRVVDIKFTTLDLLKDGRASSGHKAFMAQVWIYNQALARIQGVMIESCV